MMSLKYMLKRCTDGYKLSKSQEKINHLIYRDDNKLFDKNEKKKTKTKTKKTETRIQTVRIYSKDRGMEFGRENWAMLIMKTRKRRMTEGTTESRKNKNARRNGNLLIHRDIRKDTIKHVEMKEKIKKEYLRRTRKIPKTKLNCRKLITGILSGLSS